jgi:hypothetical protein
MAWQGSMHWAVFLPNKPPHCWQSARTAGLHGREHSRAGLAGVQGRCGVVRGLGGCTETLWDVPATGMPACMHASAGCHAGEGKRGCLTGLCSNCSPAYCFIGCDPSWWLSLLPPWGG